MARVARCLLMVGAVAVVLAACSASTSPSASAPPSGSPLDGTTWALRSIGDQAIPAGITVTLAFADGQASGTSGCNHYSGTYAVDGSSINLGPQAITEMACPEPQMAVEAAYLTALGAATTWAIPADAPLGTQLTISGADPASKLVFGPPS